MESKANYAVIGAFVLLSIFGIVAFIFYISGRQFDEEYDKYIVEYNVPPRGIDVGSEVRFNGLKMGEVIKTELDKQDPNKVLVTIKVKKDTPVHVDSYAQNEPLGLTGLSYIQLYAGKSNQPFDRSKYKGELPRIPGQGSQLESILGGSESVIDNVNLALTRAANLLDPKAAENLHGILANLNEITGKVKDTDISKERIESLMASLEQTAKDFSKAALAIEATARDAQALIKGDDVRRVIAQAENTLKVGEQTLEAYKTLAESGQVLSEDTRNVINQFSNTGLTDLNQAMTDLKTLIETLNRVSADLERSPVEFIAGQKKEETELPQ